MSEIWDLEDWYKRFRERLFVSMPLSQNVMQLENRVNVRTQI